MNIIVAILFDNYEDQETESENEELKELDEMAQEIGISSSMREFIIHKDLVLGKN